MKQIEFCSHSTVNKIVLFLTQNDLLTVLRKEKKRNVTDGRQKADTSHYFQISIPRHGRTEKKEGSLSAHNPLKDVSTLHIEVGFIFYNIISCLNLSMNI